MRRSTIVACACACALCGLGALASSLAAQGPGGRGAKTVKVDTVRRESVQDQRMVTGELRAMHRSKVAAQEAGVVIDMPAREGNAVEAGAVLARLDSRRLKLELRQVRSEAAVAQAVLEERLAVRAQAERDLTLLEASFERGAANARELDDARSTIAQAAARVVQAERQTDFIEARSELLDERLTDMVIVAPFEGVVIERYVELGEWLGEGDPVVEIVSTSAVEAWLNPPQRHLAAVTERSEPIDILIDATEEAVETSALRVIPRVDPKARTFTLVGTLLNERGHLAPGMSVTGWVPTGAMAEQLTVSKDAVLYGESGAFVYVVRDGRDDGPATVAPVPVQLMFPRHDRFVVRPGELREGDSVVVEGNERLFPSMPVIPIPVAPFTPEAGDGAATDAGAAS